MDPSQLARLARALFGAAGDERARGAAHEALAAWRQDERCPEQCLALLQLPEDGDPCTLFLAAATLADMALPDEGDEPPRLAPLLRAGRGRATLLQAVLRVARLERERMRFPPLRLALCRLLGRVAAFALCAGDWPSAVAECAALPDDGGALGLGALEHMAEAGAKLPPKLLRVYAERMRAGAGLVCQACVRVGKLEAPGAEQLQKCALKALLAWVRGGLVPNDVMLPSGCIELAVARVRWAEAVDVLTEVFATPVMEFRSAGALASYTLCFDKPSHRQAVTYVARSLLQEGHAQQREEARLPIVRLLCDIVRQHPSLLLVVDVAPPHPLRSFLVACVGDASVDVALQTVSVWSRVEPELSAQRPPPEGWVHAFRQVLLTVLQRWGRAPQDEELAQRRGEFDECVLCCAQVLGEGPFYALVRGAAPSVEAALWAAAAAAVLHDGRTEHCLPELFAAAFGLDPAGVPRLAHTACQAIVAYRLFLKQHRDGALVEAAARFCGRCLPVAANEASKALLMLAELCGERMVAGLSFVVPLAARALPEVNEDTAYALVSACAELATNLSEDAAAPLTQELLDALLRGAVTARRPENFLGAGVALCTRSVGRSGALYAERLARAWPDLRAFLESDQHADVACDLVAALATAAGAAGLALLPAVCRDLVALLHRRGTARAVVALELLLAVAPAANALAPLLVTACGAVLEYLGAREAGDVCCAYFELLKKLLWSAPWRAALAQQQQQPMLLSSLRMLCAAMHRYGSDFECLLALSEFEVELVLAAHNEPGLAALVATASGPLVSTHLRACLDGNPLAVRFHYAPLFELLRAVPAAQRAPLFAAGLGDVQHRPADPWLATAARLAATIDSSRTFKCFLSDLFDVCRGRESPDVLNQYCGE